MYSFWRLGSAFLAVLLGKDANGPFFWWVFSLLGWAGQPLCFGILLTPGSYFESLESDNISFLCIVSVLLISQTLSAKGFSTLSRRKLSLILQRASYWYKRTLKRREKSTFMSLSLGLPFPWLVLCVVTQLLSGTTENGRDRVRDYVCLRNFCYKKQRRHVRPFFALLWMVSVNFLEMRSSVPVERAVVEKSRLPKYLTNALVAFNLRKIALL